MSSRSAPPRIWAIVPAAGRGSRFSADLGAPPKQYAELLGKSLFEWSLRRLLAEPRVHGLVAVVAADDSYWPPLAAKLAEPQPQPQPQSQPRDHGRRLQSTIGGATRQQSVLNGLAHLQDQAAADDWVMVHDAARPCLTAAEIQALLTVLDSGASGAVLGAPLVDTIKREREGAVGATVDRQGLWRALTPQVFRYADLRRALQAAETAGVTATDEAQAMERLGYSPTLVPGSAFNIKVTRADDLQWAARILQTAEAGSMRIGQGFDVHAFGPGEHVVLGGVQIPYPRGVLAHSDGDVIIHALCDAVLGALGQGDIGQHFPDTDPRYRGADSRVFLREVARLLREAGLRLVNADVTVLAEGPRIAKHRLAMAANLAADLGVAAARVNIKATTTEKLGSIGRGEGLAAMAVVLVDV
jgi:2-C-methyl-D-erythritol 4-phosphate cytidylyltransferase/2-C-methyl-D-erythritol 2,4-cyclodiphosphate synthase